MKSPPERLRTDALMWNLGFVGASGQSFLFRELGLLFEGNEIVGAVMIAAWLLLSGGGALACGLARGRGILQAREWIFVLLGPALLLSVLLVRVACPFLSDLPGTSPPLGTVTFSVFVLLAPFCFPSGFLFPALLRRPAGEDRSGSRGYVFESAGFLAGGAASSLVLVPLFSNLQAVVAVLAICLAVAAAFLSSRIARAGAAALAGAALLLLLTPMAGRIDLSTRSARFPGELLLESTDTLLGTFSVTERSGLVTFRNMGTPGGDNAPSVSCEEYVHLTMLSHPNPARAALLGGGMSGELADLSRHHVSVFMTLPDRSAFRAALPHLSESDRRALQGGDLRLEFGDGRVLLGGALGSGGAFDVILVPAGDPLTGFQNRYYTVEFFRQVKEALLPGGILGLRLSSSPGYSSPARRRLATSVRRSLASVFEHVRAVRTHDAGTVLLSSDAPLRLDRDSLGANLARAGFTTEVVNPRWIEEVADAAAEAETEARSDGDPAPLNTDMKPVSYLLAFSLWESRFRASSAAVLAGVSIPPFALLLAASFWAWRRKGRGCRALGPPWAAAAAGFAGMAFEVGLLVAFQSAAGYLYGFLGALVAAFMAGACAGAIAGFRTSRPGHASIVLGAAFLLLGIGCWTLLPAVAHGLGLFGAILVFAALQLVSGFLTGGFFPLALRSHSPGEREGAGVVYASDLGGAALGALLGGAVIIPLLGIPILLLVAGAAAFAGSLLLAAQPADISNPESKI